MASWFLSALEGLDDDHCSAAMWARLDEDRRFRVIGGVGVIGLGGRHAEQFAGQGDVAGAPAIGKQSVVTDAVETVGWDVNEEAADELGYRQGHGLVQLTIFGAVVLPFEDDLLVVKGARKRAKAWPSARCA